MTWTNNGWKALGATELAAIILVFIVVSMGFIALAISSACCLITLMIFLLLSFLFTLAIAIFVFIGTQVRYWNEYVGCNTQYKGFLKAWGSVDIYLQSVDELFCSYRCPCYFNRTTSYKFIMNTTAAPYYNQWVKYDLKLKPIRFQQCNDTEIAEAYNNYLMRNAYYNYSLRQDWFHTYYRHIEEYFHCTGFCSMTYNNSITGTNMKIVKYLFSDVTKGVPEHIGCLDRMLDWLRKTLNAFGAVCLFMFVVESILFIIVLMLIGIVFAENRAIAQSKKKQEKQIEMQNMEKDVEEKKIIEENHVEPKEEEKKLKEEPMIVSESSFRPNESQLEEKSIEFIPAV